MPVDTSYASDENVQTAKGFDVKLVGPIPGSNSKAAADDLTIDDFNVGETSGQVVCCPAGHKPVSSVHDTETGKTRTTMPDSACGTCEYFEQCPVEKKRSGYQVDHTAKQRRTAARRYEEATEVFRASRKYIGQSAWPVMQNPSDQSVTSRNKNGRHCIAAVLVVTELFSRGINDWS